MGYPRYATDLKPVCMRFTRLKPMTVLEPRADSKSIKILVSELNPPICALIKEMAQGGTKGSVPITFASTATMARTCPPPPCDCKPCPVLTEFQIWMKRLILASKIAFLAGSIALMWYIGGLGPTWDTWNLKECVKNYYYACNNIKFVYRDKCKPIPEPDKGPICYSTETDWNRKVLTIFHCLTCLYYMTTGKFMEMVNYESCDYVKPPKPKREPWSPPTRKPPKPDYRKIYLSLFSALDPINIPCDESPDYYMQLNEMMQEDDDE